jgi:hypothetical protein
MVVVVLAMLSKVFDELA